MHHSIASVIIIGEKYCKITERQKRMQKMAKIKNWAERGYPSIVCITVRVKSITRGLWIAYARIKKKFDKNWNRKQYSLDYFSTGNFPFVLPTDSFFHSILHGIFRSVRILFVNRIVFRKHFLFWLHIRFPTNYVRFKRICVSVKCYS